jgi:hypothetical protein
MYFGPHITVGYARQVVRREAGPDAQLVYDRKTTWRGEAIEYRSTLLSQALGRPMSAVLCGDESGGGPFHGLWVLYIAFFTTSLPNGVSPIC